MRVILLGVLLWLLWGLCLPAKQIKQFKQVKPRVFIATAYEPSARSCGRWARYNRTASGIRPHKGIIAADTRVLPFHTRVYVEGYGFATVEDRGGSIRGNRIDVYFPTVKECMKWGRRKVKVWVLK